VLQKKYFPTSLSIGAVMEQADSCGGGGGQSVSLFLGGNIGRLEEEDKRTSVEEEKNWRR
jgi:hypothetical protein